ncbi:FtsK/SpoIIIE domain-containing protein [Nocardia sp. NPDC051463]|uniref:FtsK/SpoIIIE domain-containing protein n=1 Tax=Nocardia sp. NPDC051463 TaxID=3154845 RepID=UPI00344D5317
MKWPYAARLAVSEVLGGTSQSFPGPSATRGFSLPQRVAAEVFGVRLAPETPVWAPTDASYDRPFSVLDLAEPYRVDLEELHSREAARNRHRVAIGKDADGRPVIVDLMGAEEGGDGPHGLLAGVIGTGRSELLRNLVLDAAVVHPSTSLNFVLADWHGGATWSGFERLPHVSSIITNMTAEPPLIGRFEDALRAEMHRRTEVLHHAGFTALGAYEAARRAGDDLDEMATLLVVIENFTEFVAARPAFAGFLSEALVIGRSVGVNLLLVASRLPESLIGVLRGVMDQLTYRIVLAMHSRQEWATALGVVAAPEMPAIRLGHGYFRSRDRAPTPFGFSEFPASEAVVRQLSDHGPYAPRFL